MGRPSTARPVPHLNRVITERNADVFASSARVTAVRQVMRMHGSKDDRFHACGYTTTTPFDMVMVNQIDRFHIAIDALRAERLRTKTLKVVDPLQHKLAEHVIYTRENLVGMREITKWHWTDGFSDPVAPPPIARTTV
jgi:phosphoketolase